MKKHNSRSNASRLLRFCRQLALNRPGISNIQNLEQFSFWNNLSSIASSHHRWHRMLCLMGHMQTNIFPLTEYSQTLLSEGDP